MVSTDKSIRSVGAKPPFLGLSSLPCTYWSHIHSLNTDKIVVNLSIYFQLEKIHFRESLFFYTDVLFPFKSIIYLCFHCLSSFHTFLITAIVLFHRITKKTNCKQRKDFTMQDKNPKAQGFSQQDISFDKKITHM